MDIQHNPHRLLMILPLLLALAGSACRRTEAPVAQTGWPLPAGLPVATVTWTEAPDTFVAVGSVEARTSATLAARVTGMVLEVRVQPGQRVRAGQLLAVLSNPQAGEEVQAQQAALAAAEASLHAAQQQHRAAQANADLAHSTYDRYRGLAQAVSPHELETVSAAAQAAQAAQQAAVAQEQAAQAGVRQNQATLQAARTGASFSRITAPYSAIVTAKWVDAGALATPGLPLLQIERPGASRLAVSVPNTVLPAVHLGQHLAVEIDGHVPAQMDGVVGEIAPDSDTLSRSALVKLDLPAAAKLRSGLYGRVAIPTGSRRALLAPASALLHRGDLDEIYVVNGAGRAELRLVKPGAVLSGQVEILSGLSPGEHYVLHADNFLATLQQDSSHDN
ncbi:MAG: efflux RND transporter periplasmic adaptor subunit [Terriglobales bacterium]